MKTTTRAWSPFTSNTKPTKPKSKPTIIAKPTTTSKPLDLKSLTSVIQRTGAPLKKLTHIKNTSLQSKPTPAVTHERAHSVKETLLNPKKSASRKINERRVAENFTSQAIFEEFDESTDENVAGYRFSDIYRPSKFVSPQDDAKNRRISLQPSNQGLRSENVQVRENIPLPKPLSQKPINAPVAVATVNLNVNNNINLKEKERERNLSHKRHMSEISHIPQNINPPRRRCEPQDNSNKENVNPNPNLNPDSRLRKPIFQDKDPIYIDRVHTEEDDVRDRSRYWRDNSSLWGFQQQYKTHKTAVLEVLITFLFPSFPTIFSPNYLIFSLLSRTKIN